MVLSPDHFLYDASGAYGWSPEGVASAWRQTMDRARVELPSREALFLLVGLPGSGKSTWLASYAHGDERGLFIDATFTRRDSRAPWIALAREVGKPCYAIFLDTSVEECVRRNDLRPIDRRVPRERMESMVAQLTNEPPTLEEGFAEVLRV